MPEPMTYSNAEERLTAQAVRIRDAEKAYEEAVKSAADAEATYRRAVASKLDEHREAGLSVEHANAKARADCYVLSRERDFASGMVRKALEVLEDRRGERESLHRLVAWSHSIDIRDRNGALPDGNH